VAIAALGLIGLVVVGTVGYLAFGYGPGSALAMTLLTLTTVGFATSQGLRTDVLLFTGGLAVLGKRLYNFRRLDMSLLVKGLLLQK
jgi:hypothetical protein